MPKPSCNTPSAHSGPLAYPASGAASVLDGRPAQRRHLVDAGDVCLMIIDPQLDFHDADRTLKRPKGSLAVKGATADSRRTAKMLQKYGDRISRVVVTLDSHHKMHICHSCFWKNASGEHPKPFTEITRKAVEMGVWVPVQPGMLTWAVRYCGALEAGKRFTHIIWPDHCLIGTPGAAVEARLQASLDEWATAKQASVTWLLKGQNNKTEMYSALKAEVPVPGDATTKLNTTLIKALTTHRKVVVCGQAKSHCVNQTFRDLAERWPTSRMDDLILVQDCTSPVAGFEAVAETFEKDVIKMGARVLKSTSNELKQIFDADC